MDFTTSQSWLENVGRIDGSLCSTGSDERVEFVDEQNCVLGSSNFVHNRFDAFFELSTILRSSNHHCQIENNDPLIGEDFGHFAIDYALCETFDDGGFTDAGFSEENGIVFRASA